MKTHAITSLSPESLQIARDMIHYCIQNGIGMGMDEGWHEKLNKRGEPVRFRKRKFRKELEGFCDFKS